MEQKFKSILEETKTEVELLKMENEAWKDKLIKESWKKLKSVDTKFENEMEMAESNLAGRSHGVKWGEQKPEFAIESSTRSKRMLDSDDPFKHKTFNLDCNESNYFEVRKLKNFESR